MKLGSWGIGHIIGTFAALLALSSVIISITLHPPAVQRQIKFDQLRVQALQDIKGHLEAYWRNHKALPSDLVVLSGDRLQGVWRDPDTKVPYVYQMTSSDAYRLCATFSLQSADTGFGVNDIWPHPAGTKCYEQTVANIK